MLWRRWFRHDNHDDSFDDPPLKVELLVERSLHSRVAAQAAIDQLRDESKRIDRQRRQLRRNSSRPTGAQFRTYASSGGQMSEVLASQAMNTANAQAEAQQRREDQLTALDVRQTTVRRAIEQLKQVR